MTAGTREPAPTSDAILVSRLISRYYESLTPAELRCLTLLVRGESSAEIAEDLICATKTIKTHVGHILAKLQVPTRARAVYKALALQIVVIDATDQARFVAERRAAVEEMLSEDDRR